MSETPHQDLSGVAETSLIALYIRAIESQRTDALIKDERAEAVVRQLDQEYLRKTTALTEDTGRVVMILKTREFDRFAQDFLGRHPDAVVVHIGCGLDTRFERVCSEQPDNGRVEWYDLDLPDVIDLRRKLVEGEELALSEVEGARHHFLACSVLDSAWLDTVSAHRQRPYLFLAEGVLMYFDEAQVKSLVLTLRDHFPGAELVFDALSPIHVWRHNLQMRTFKIAIHVHWGIWRGQKIEGWGNSIRLLDEWGFFDQPEPRLAPIRWLRPFESLARTIRIYHFRLGKAAG